jgi:hypothetical protein
MQATPETALAIARAVQGAAAHSRRADLVPGLIFAFRERTATRIPPNLRSSCLAAVRAGRQHHDPQ